MAQLPQRSFSFNFHDEGSLQPGAPRQDQYSQPYREQQQQYGGYQVGSTNSYLPQHDRPGSVSPPPASPPRAHPAAHPSSTFGRLQEQRQYGMASGTTQYRQPSSPTYRDEQEYGFPSSSAQQIVSPVSPASPTRKPLPSRAPLPLPTDSSVSSAPPPPPVHRTLVSPSRADEYGRTWRRERGNQPSTERRRGSDTTPDQDNLGDAAAGGGITGIALGVANTNERQSGVQALRDIDNFGRQAGPNTYSEPVERRFNGGYGESDPYGGPPGQYSGAPYNNLQHNQSYGSTVPLAHAHSGPQTPGQQYSDRTPPLRGSPYSNPFEPSNPFNHSGDRLGNRGLGGPIDPMDIADDGEDDMLSPHPKRKSFLGLGHSRTSSRSRSREGFPVAAAGATGAAAAAGMLGGMAAKHPSGQYQSVPGGAGDRGIEKSEWLNKQSKGNKKLKWTIGILVALIIIGGIAGGVVGGILASKKNRDSGGDGASPGQSADDDNKQHGDLDLNSAEIKALMNNKDLHKVFPGVDYTPIHTQYPACLTSPPSQNNVTRDMAILSQMTNRIRLYGTDCNQTEMVLHAIDRLQLEDMKVWLGVWQDNNATTNERQLSQLWNIIDNNKDGPFAGVAVGNEVLFRKDMSSDALGLVLAGVKTNLTSRGLNLPLATSDLGDNWTAQLATEVDVIMSNIHPFFAGVTASAAAGWAWDFWQNHDVVLTAGMTGKTHVISEIGWPSAGGNNCGMQGACTSSDQGSIAGIDEMNTFMESFVCQGLANGTDYFWFEAFDEPWKVQFNTPTQQWEDKWGLMDVNRKLKPGLKIPDCGGKTVS